MFDGSYGICALGGIAPHAAADSIAPLDDVTPPKTLALALPALIHPALCVMDAMETSKQTLTFLKSRFSDRFVQFFVTRIGRSFAVSFFEASVVALSLHFRFNWFASPSN